MCCSIRAAVYFLASLHLFFAVTQMVQTLPTAVTVIGTKLLESVSAFVVCISFFATGFMTFRGADEESATLIRLGSYCIIIVVTFRFVLMAFSKALVKTLPEAAFLYIYDIPFLPIIYTIFLYVVYLVLLFCYHNELKKPSLSHLPSSPTHFTQHSPRHRRHSRSLTDSIH